MAPEALSAVSGGPGHVVVVAPARDHSARWTWKLPTRWSRGSSCESLLEGYWAEPCRLFPVPYLLSGDGADFLGASPRAPWRPSPGRTLADFEYHCRQQALARRREASEDDLAVAAHTLMTAPDRTSWSWALRSSALCPGLLLPVVDRLLLAGKGPRAPSASPRPTRLGSLASSYVESAGRPSL